MTGKIDFIIAWVDDSDPEWKSEFEKHKKLWTAPARDQTEADISDERYRDWDTLRYWFRGVEKFAPWVNKVHFLTWGHIPEWLNADHPKLNIVKHEDFIPEKYLPTFNSCPIELNMHRIEGLSERFVYFNDDMFLCKPVPQERFFKKGLPCDMARLNVIRNERIDHNMLECVRVINKRHPRKGVIRNNFGKWFNLRYPAGDMMKTLTLLPWSFWPGFKEHHSPQPFLKETFEKLWQEEAEELDTTCSSRFRTLTDLPQWIMHYDQLVSGNFYPINIKDSKLTKLSDTNTEDIKFALLSGKYSMVCINDSNTIADPLKVKNELINAFNELLPDKSEYER